MSKEKRKKGVSVRMSTDDLDRLKRIANHLSVRDSDVIRYSVKSMLKRLAPLADKDKHHVHLLPIFIEHGAELASAFDLSTDKIDEIINSARGNTNKKVARNDIELLTISGPTEGYQQLHISEALKPDKHTGDIGLHLKEYLYDKYLSDIDISVEQPKKSKKQRQESKLSQ